MFFLQKKVLIGHVQIAAKKAGVVPLEVYW